MHIKGHLTPSSKPAQEVCAGTTAALALTACNPAPPAALPLTQYSLRSSIPRNPQIPFRSSWTSLPTRHLHTEALCVYCQPCKTDRNHLPILSLYPCTCSIFLCSNRHHLAYYISLLLFYIPSPQQHASSFESRSFVCFAHCSFSSVEDKPGTQKWLNICWMKEQKKNEWTNEHSFYRQESWSLKRWSQITQWQS